MKINIYPLSSLFILCGIELQIIMIAGYNQGRVDVHCVRWSLYFKWFWYQRLEVSASDILYNSNTWWFMTIFNSVVSFIQTLIPIRNNYRFQHLINFIPTIWCISIFSLRILWGPFHHLVYSAFSLGRFYHF